MILGKIDVAINKIEEALLIFSWIATLFVTFLFIIDISGRFLLNLPLPASYEIGEVTMPFIVMLGFASTLNKGIHVRVTLFIDLLTPKVKLGLNLFNNMAPFVMCVIIVYWSWLQFWHSFIIGEEMLAPIKIPWWIGKLAMPIAFGMLGIRYFMLVILALTSKQSSQYRR